MNLEMVNANCFFGTCQNLKSPHPNHCQNAKLGQPRPAHVAGGPGRLIWPFAYVYVVHSSTGQESFGARGSKISSTHLLLSSPSFIGHHSANVNQDINTAVPPRYLKLRSNKSMSVLHRGFEKSH